MMKSRAYPRQVIYYIYIISHDPVPSAMIIWYMIMLISFSPQTRPPPHLHFYSELLSYKKLLCNSRNSDFFRVPGKFEYTVSLRWERSFGHGSRTNIYQAQCGEPSPTGKWKRRIRRKRQKKKKKKNTILTSCLCILFASCLLIVSVVRINHFSDSHMN